MGAPTESLIVAGALFVVATVFLLYVPGRFILDRARVELTPLESTALALVLGMATASLLYFLAAYLGVPQAFLVWPAIATAAWGYRRWRRWTWPHVRGALTPAHLALAGAVLVALSPFAVIPAYYPNVRPTANGELTFSRLADVIFHLAVTNELTHTVPPQVPYFSDLRLSYHFGVNLLGAMFHRFTGLGVGDLTVRFVPTLVMTATMLAIFCFSRAWLRSSYAAIVTSLLVVLGEDLSFVPGLLLRPQDVWSERFFAMPSVAPLYWMNPILPAVGLMFAGLFCLLRDSREPRRAWLMLAAFLFASAAEYKVFTAVYVVAGLGLSGVVALPLWRDRRLLTVTGLTTLALLPIAVYTWVVNRTAGRIWMRLDPYPYVGNALERVGLHVSGPLGELVFLAALPIYLIATLGVRALALPTVAAELTRPSPQAPLRFLVAALFVVGIVLTLVLRVTPEDDPETYNDAVWFFLQAKYVVSIFVVERLLAFWERWGRWARVALVAGVVGLSAPSALQYFRYEFHTGLHRLEPTHVEVLRALASRCERGEVVFARPAVAETVIAQTRCRTPILTRLAPTAFAPGAEIARRATDLTAFWAALERGEVRADILARYRTRYLVVDTRQDPAPSGAALQTVLANRDFALYRVAVPQ